MKQILVIADDQNDQQTAYLKALKLAKLTSSAIHITVFCYESLTVFNANHMESVKEEILIQNDQWWKGFLLKNPPPVMVSYEIVWEKYLHNWILAHCKDIDCDLIVKTGCRSETLVYTPSDWHLFRKATVPIYSVNKKNRKAEKIVLVALDLLTENESKQQLNEKLLEQAFRLSVSTDATLHCCFVIKISTIVKDMGLIDVAAHEKQMEETAREKCQQWLDKYDIDSQNFHLKSGAPWRVITGISRNLKTQCLVIGSMGRAGVPGKLIGNTSEKVIQHATADLLVMNLT